MNVQRTPPRASLMSGSGSGTGSGSVPNLPTYYDESFVNFNARKRKERTDEEEHKQDLESFRTDIMNFLNEFAKTQNEKLSNIRDEICEIKNEIKTIKTAKENFTQQLNKLNSDIENIKSDNSITKEKIKNMEQEISILKSTETRSESPSKSLFSSHVDLILELKERSEREQNVVIVGIPEKNDKSFIARRTHDMEEFMKVATTLIENYRPLKICFANRDTPRLLLQKRSKLPENTNIKIYSDQTIAQKQYLQSVREELRKRLENGEDNLVIKYNKGIPFVTKMKDNQKN
ncbi:hypothetical protein ABMA28_010650 [Loxostege sticticalis]|uniref:Uncharacterized protein n=1 Tax=Loxostege sticticalis TaxID=481309 RepID=A0ABD0S8Y5_LOXSC